MDNNRIAKAEQKYTAFIAKNKKLFLDLVSNSFMIQTQQKYLDWLLDGVSREKVNLPLSDILLALQHFEQIGGRLDRKNIYSYRDIYDVQSAVVAYLEKESKGEAKALEDKKKQQDEKKDMEPGYYSMMEFNTLFYQKVAETYPRTITKKDRFTLNASYETDENGMMRLVYEIPYYNVLLHVRPHFLDLNAPLTIFTQDLTSARETKKHKFELAFSRTAFVHRSMSFSLYEKATDGASMALKMTEFSVLLFLDSPEFLRFFSEEMVFHVGTSDTFVADRFLSYVKSKRESGAEATKYDYVVNHLHKNNTHIRSFQNAMIEALKNAGVIQKEKTENGYTYSLGPNYQAYREGRLKPA